MKKWLEEHEWVRRALRTFFQTAAGVLAAAVAEASGVVSGMDLEAVIVMAVATGLAAVMNLTGKEGGGHGGSDTGGV